MQAYVLVEVSNEIGLCLRQSSDSASVPVTFNLQVKKIKKQGTYHRPFALQQCVPLNSDIL